MSTDLVLHAESAWVSPWVFHAMVALEEKGLPYRVETTPLPMPASQRADWLARAGHAKVPLLVHGDLWVTESLAISEYVAERFPSTAGFPRLFPPNLADRARSRQVMSWLRTSLMALRAARPTSSVFGAPLKTGMPEAAKADADELVRVASKVVPVGRTTMFEAWCIADADLGLALMRLVANDDPVPAHLVDYAVAQWQRPSSRKFLANVPTTR